MKLEVIKKVVTSKVGRQILLARKHSPVILFAAGVVGVVGTAVLASRATLKIDDILDEHEETLEKIEAGRNGYSAEEAQADKIKVYFRTAGKLTKVYAPAVLVGAVSIAALTGSHVILSKRNASIAAAYAVLDKGFRRYRERVVDELGVEKDRDFMYDREERDFLIQTENGQVVKKLKVAGKNNISPYARFFDVDNRNYVSNYNYNQMFISCQQNWANDLLRSRGHVFLNEVYDMLGLEHSREGAVVGWILGGDGDDFIDFGVFDGDVHSGLLFVNGSEPTVLLDFNVDGIIWDKI